MFYTTEEPIRALMQWLLGEGGFPLG